MHDYYNEIARHYGDDANIKLDEKVEGPDGQRQCDIIIEHSYLGTKYRTLIECKDYSSSVAILHVDALSSKLDDLNCNKGVIVARTGFQRGAIDKAARKGIDLYSFSEATKAVSDLNMRLPVLHLVIKIKELSLVFDATPEIVPPLIQLTSEVSSEMSTHAFVIKHLMPDHRFLSGIGFKRVRPERELSLRSITDHFGFHLIQDHVLSNMSAYVKHETTAYLGALRDVKNFFVRKNVVSGKEDVWIPSGYISKLREDLPFFSDTGSVPEYLFKGGFKTYSFDLDEPIPRKGLFDLELVRDAFESRYGGLPPPSGKWLAVYTQEDIYR